MHERPSVLSQDTRPAVGRRFQFAQRCCVQESFLVIAWVCFADSKGSTRQCIYAIMCTGGTVNFASNIGSDEVCNATQTNRPQDLCGQTFILEFKDDALRISDSNSPIHTEQAITTRRQHVSTLQLYHNAVRRCTICESPSNTQNSAAVRETAMMHYSKRFKHKHRRHQLG